MSRTLSFDKKKSLSNGYKQNWGIISLLLGKKWSHEQSLPNDNHMQFTFIYFIFIVTENTTFDLQLILRYIQASDLVTPIIK